MCCCSFSRRADSDVAVPIVRKQLRQIESKVPLPFLRCANFGSFVEGLGVISGYVLGAIWLNTISSMHTASEVQGRTIVIETAAGMKELRVRAVENVFFFHASGRAPAIANEAEQPREGLEVQKMNPSDPISMKRSYCKVELH